MGRPKKENAVKPGQLQPGYAVYGFITKKEYCGKEGLIKQAARQAGLSAKDFMTGLVEDYFLKNNIVAAIDAKQRHRRPNKKNEGKLLEYLSKQQNKKAVQSTVQRSS